MPAPVEYNNVRRMSTISAPIHDINFDTYDFLLCPPQTDVKDTFESRELEKSFCRDFACCGLVLNDLHDLLQHYEECHVRLEEDQVFFDGDQDSSDGDIEVPIPQRQQLFQQQVRQQQQNDDQGLATFGNSQDLDINHLKKKAAAYLSDLCQQQQQQQQQLVETGDDSDLDNMKVKDEWTKMQQQNMMTGKKRSFEQSNAMDLISQSVKKFALATNLMQPSETAINNNTTTSGFTDEDFLAHAGALLASSAHHSHLHPDKPYKCQIKGCDKAYKNPNGLKYHKEHGHSLTEDNETPKPYQCTIGLCGKKYKNLNGLKYHIEHSHVAALNYTLATFAPSLLQQHPHYLLPYNPPQSSSSLSTPELSPSSSPELSYLSPNF